MTLEDSWGGDIVTAAIAHLAHSTPPEFLFTATDFNSYVTPQRGAGRAAALEAGASRPAPAPGLGVTPDRGGCSASRRSWSRPSRPAGPMAASPTNRSGRGHAQPVEDRRRQVDRLELAGRLTPASMSGPAATSQPQGRWLPERPEAKRAPRSQRSSP